MNVRKAKIEDIKQISLIMMQVQELHCKNRDDIFRKRDIKEIENEIIETIMGNTEKNIIVAENDFQEVVGILVCKIREIKENTGSNRKPSKTLNIEELGVEEKQRKKGIGTMLMREAEKIRDELECERLELNCWEFNQDAMKFYKSCGLKVQRTFFEK